MKNLIKESWDKRLRLEARSDNYALFRDHLRRLGLPTKPKLMLEATISVLQAVWIYENLDGITPDKFLNMQRYNPIDASEACYCFTFDLGGKAYARVLADSKLILPDLADLYGQDWEDYEICGYNRVWITHPDWSPLTSEELKLLEDEVTDDLRFDYSEDELDFWFETGPNNSFLLVNLQEVYYEDEEDEEQ